MEDTKHLTFQEQVRRLLDENIDKYPDAVRWMMDCYGKDSNAPTRKTEYETFIDRLSGKHDWHSVMNEALRRHPVSMETTTGGYASGSMYDRNKVERIKFLRAHVYRVGDDNDPVNAARLLGLKDAKDLVESYNNDMDLFNRVVAKLHSEIELRYV